MTHADDGEPRRVVVTGCNRRIGYALVRSLIKRGDHVRFTARSPQRGMAALSRLSDEHPFGQVAQIGTREARAAAEIWRSV